MRAPEFPPRYLVRGLLGEGASGSVYRAYDSVRDRDLALKTVRPSEAEFLRREFETLRQIRHENLIQVLDLGSLASSEAYYTMEFVEGEDWGKRMGNPQPPEDVRRILTGLLRGLAHLHCHGELHGDIKPGNVLLGLGGVVKLSDVGMGACDGIETRASGTPGYIAPEIWEGKRADVRSDLYSVGVLAYEALTGRHPFSGRSLRDIVTGQLEGWVPSPEALGYLLPRQFVHTMMRALEREPSLRPSSADELMEGLGVEEPVGRILGGKVVGRDDETHQLLAVLRGQEPGAPTAIALAGTSLEDRVELVRDLSARAGSLGCVVSPLGAILGDICPGSTPGGIAEVGDRLWGESRNAPVLVDIDGARAATDCERDFARGLSRYLWAMSLERGEPPRVLCAFAEAHNLQQEDEFVLVVDLPALSEVDFAAAVDAVLGRTQFPADFTRHLHLITGGDPGLIGPLVDDLIRKDFIARSGGTWRLRAEQDVRSISVPGLTNRWAAEWSHLDEVERDALVRVAIASGGSGQAREPDLAGDSSILQRLSAAGWLQPSAGSWAFSSQTARDVVVGTAEPQRRSRIALQLLEGCGASLARESRADLVLEVGDVPEAIREGLWAAEAARARSDFRTALRRLDRVLSLALSQQEISPARESALRLAEAAQASGMLERAWAVLSDPATWCGVASPQEQARRSLLLGLVAKSRGQLAEARQHLNQVISLCPRGEPRQEYLRAVVELSEVDWRHSDSAARQAAIQQLSATLPLVPATPEYEGIRGAIVYGLGAAQFLAGQFRAAREWLAEGLAGQLPDLYRIRILNALSMTVGRLGDFESALAHLNDAWAIAERAGLDEFKPRLLSSRGSVLSRMGRAVEAAGEDMLSAKWARRLGNRFEYAAGCSGAATNLVAAARYEDAIRLSREAQEAAKAVGSRIYMLKECETEALALYSIGLRTDAERLTRDGLAPITSEIDVQVKPRLLWLLGKILIGRGENAGARESLCEARDLLATAPDSEDLLGVEIELHRLGAAEDAEPHAQGIARILSAEAARANWSVVLPGAVILAEIDTMIQLADANHMDILTSALGRAEEYGWREVAWRLSSALGQIHLTLGERKLAQTRLAHATRALREVVSDLSAEHQRVYVTLPHVRALLAVGPA